MRGCIQALEPRTLLAVDLLADLNTAPNGSDANLFVRLGQRVIFSAQTADRFGGLWSTDGTPQGTHLLPQVTRLGADFDSAVIGDTMYFVGIPSGQDPDTTPGTLWKTDGTAAGTVQVSNVHPHRLWDLGNGSLIFTENDIGTEPLWVSDGTAAGTVKISDVGPYSSFPATAMAYRKKFYFAAHDNYPDTEQLWVSDGTAAGTQLLSDIQLKFGEQDIREISAAGDHVFIATRRISSPSFSRLYATDGSSNVIQVYSASTYLNGSIYMTDIDGMLYFQSQDFGRTWKSDGTVKGTVPANVGLMSLYMGRVGSTMMFVNDVFLLAYDYGKPVYRLVYRFDKNLGYNYDITDVAVIDGVMYFRGASTANGWELWRTDGTTEGTKLLVDVNAGPGYSSPTQITALGSRILLSADTGDSGVEPIVVDPAARKGSRVQYLYDLPGTEDSDPAPIVTLGDTHLFSVRTGVDQWELWKTDGTSGQTVKVMDDIGPASAAVNYGGVAYFISNRTLWRSDGTAEGTVAMIERKTPDFGAHWMGMVRGRLYVEEFNYFGPPYPRGTLYAIDTPGAALRAVASTGQAGTTILLRNRLMYFNTRLYSPTRFQWYVSNGTTTLPMENGATYDWPGPGQQPPPAPQVTPPFADSISINGNRFYAFDDGVHGTELWIDDGSSARMLADLYFGATSSFPDGLAVANDHLVFAATTPDVGRELRTINLRSVFSPGRPTIGDAPAGRFSRAFDDVFTGEVV
jgi:ELWxxDGT repeat protein